jgi:hypothetical protein
MVMYTIGRGDTLGNIAKRFYGSASKFPLLVAANKIPNPDKLSIGQRLVIPEAAVALGASNAAIPNPMVVSSSSERRIASIHPSVATRARAMVHLCSQSGVEVVITQGLRSWQEQDQLYAKGRTILPLGSEHFVTMAKGGQSYHNFGLAFDIVVLDAIGKADWDVSHSGWATAAEIGKSLGLEWGGDWKKFKDRPHFQYTGGLPLAECCSLYKSGMDSIWARVVG